MEENKQYYLFVNRKKVPVTEAVYLAHLQMKDHEYYLERKDRLKGKVLYSEMDTDEMSGEEAIPDLTAERIDDLVANRLMVEKLRICLELLDATERALIKALFFDIQSERQVASQLGVSQVAIHKRKMKILANLKKLLER